MSIGKLIIELGSTASTNDYAAGLLNKSRPEHGTVILAREQTRGRGVDGNSWESEAGKSLTFSVIIYPSSLPASSQFYLNKAVSLAMVRSIDEIVPGTEARIKWPNDIYLNDGKAAGILISHGVIGNILSYSIIGIGLNVNQEVFPGNVPNPVSLKGIAGQEFGLKKVLETVCKHLDQQLDAVRQQKLDLLNAEYINSLYRFGVQAAYFWKGEAITGTIIDVSETGKLIMKLPGDEVIECDYKEIEYLI